MKLSLARILLASLALSAIVFAAAPASAVEGEKAPASLDQVFTKPATSSVPAPIDGQSQPFIPLASTCSNLYCQSNNHCRQICGDPAVICDFFVHHCVLL